ncbi:MAG: undecaprenyl-diphosphate phosphatase [Candidatus Pacearchaeota archaeon]
MDLTGLQSVILGAVQGISEWLPVSSSGIIALILSNFYEVSSADKILESALWLHLGTFLAALIYFRKDVLKLVKIPLYWKISQKKEKETFKFLLIATAISGAIGFFILEVLTASENSLELTGKTITFFVGLFLLFTGIIQLKVKISGNKKETDISYSDGIIAGVSQGLAAFPGVSRSGITVASLLLKKFNETSALRLSFLMSLPIVLVGNLFLNLDKFYFGGTSIYALVASFVFGILTIHGLMKISKKVNFGWFVLIFALLMILSVLF